MPSRNRAAVAKCGIERQGRRHAFAVRHYARLLSGVLICAFGLAISTPAATDPAELTALKKKYERPPGNEDTQHAISVASIVLGSRLFVEKQLSLNGNVACSSCHDPKAGFADHNAKSKGDGGILTRRRTPTLIGVGWQSSFGWDGGHPTLEDMVMSPIRSHEEMNLTIDGAVARLAASPVDGKLFASAFPAQGVSAETIAMSLANFLRSRRPPASRFDNWINGDETALSAAEKRGFLVFNGAGECATCHSGWRFTDDGFHDIGLADQSDLGRGAILPQIASMAHAFKTPTLRSIADRAPYMHDGSLKTLEDVIAHYEKGGIQRASLSADMHPLKLSPSDKSDLMAFLQSLSPDPGHSKREQRTP